MPPNPWADDHRGDRPRRQRAHRRVHLRRVRPHPAGADQAADRPHQRGRDRQLGGSSLGGLVLLRLGLKFPEVFTAGVDVRWNDRLVLKEVDAFEGPRPRIWLDIGGREGQKALHDARLLRDHLMAKGWSDADFHCYEDRRGDHSERAWGRRARMMPEFFFVVIIPTLSEREGSCSRTWTAR